MIRVHHHFLSPLSRQEWQDSILAMLKTATDVPCRQDERLLVELFLGRDGDIAALNHSRMGCMGPTNILSFPSGQDFDAECEGAESMAASSMANSADANIANSEEPADPVVGTLFLSVDTLRRECLLYGQEQEIHAQRLLAHGLAHILGYDHGPEMDELCEAMLATACVRA